MQKILLAILLAGVGASAAAAQEKVKVDPARVDAAVKAAFPTAPADWQPRLVPDETMRLCSAHNNSPPAAISEQIQAREKARIEYPADGKLVGDWKAGEKLAQSGYGLRFTDYPPRGANGGNCYACHQVSPQEVSYGTIGPSLVQYGKLRKFGEADAKAVYERIYSPHATFPCSNMPRFGVNKVLTIDQIKDLVALLMSPDSPVNK
ncbi:MAG TPA: sulfur oxidation c-type cytochrome SoxX [Xanthobacteraceae bacterium]